MAPRCTKKPRVSHSTRAGIIFPVTRMHGYLKKVQTATTRITKGAAVYLASVVEYLVAELLELSGNAARHNRRIRITPRHILLAVASDEELHTFLHGCVIPQGGVLPSIHPFLVKKCRTGDSQDEPPSTRTKKTAVFSSITKTAARKSALTKGGLESFIIDSVPKSKLNVVQGDNINVKADAIVSPTNNSPYMTGKIATRPQHTSSIDIRPNTKWKQNGLTVAGGNCQGDGINQLNTPMGLYVDDDQTIFVADYNNHRIVEWKHGATRGQVVAGGNGQGNGDHQLSYPYEVIVDKERDSLIISDLGNKRVVRWSRQNGVTSGETIISNITCWGLVMDENGSLYVVDNEKHQVRRYRTDDTEGTVVAGSNEGGDRLDQLHYPRYVFVDRDHSLYVSDSRNNRVMKWEEGAKEGIVVAGGQLYGNSLTQLSHPKGIFIDQLGTLYVVNYNRIMRWRKGATKGSVIAGGNYQGKQSNQLDDPYGLSFDRYGNIYVADFRNHRVQKFSIEKTKN